LRSESLGPPPYHEHPQLTSTFEAHLSALNLVDESEPNMEESEESQNLIAAMEQKEAPELEPERGLQAEQQQAFRAFVVQNESKTISYINGSSKVMLQNGERSKSTEDKSKAIVVGQITDKMCPKQPEPARPDQRGGDDEPALTPLVNSMINDASNLCVNGIRETNVSDTEHIEEGNLRMVGDQVVRQNVVENLMHSMHKMTNIAGGGKARAFPNNPTTNKFSTYFLRDTNDSVGGTLLTKEEQIVDGFVPLFAAQHEETPTDSVNGDHDGTAEEATNGGTESTIRKRMRTRNRQRRDFATAKRAKKYCAPSEELTRLQIREDIRKMRNPKIEDMEQILKVIGFDEFVNHESFEKYALNRSKFGAYHNGEAAADEDVQFIGVSKANKKKRKRKRRGLARNNADYALSKHDEVSPADSANGAEPQRKRLKAGGEATEVLQCPQCHKIFTLEVDLLIHKVNDHCAKL